MWVTIFLPVQHMHGPTWFLVDMQKLYPNTSQLAPLRKVIFSNASANERYKAAQRIVMQLVTQERNAHKAAKVVKAWHAYQAWHRRYGHIQTNIAPRKRKVEVPRALGVQKKARRVWWGFGWRKPNAQPAQPPSVVGPRHLNTIPHHVMVAKIIPHLSAKNSAQLALANKAFTTNAVRHSKHEAARALAVAKQAIEQTAFSIAQCIIMLCARHRRGLVPAPRFAKTRIPHLTARVAAHTEGPVLRRILVHFTFPGMSMSAEHAVPVYTVTGAYTLGRPVAHKYKGFPALTKMAHVLFGVLAKQSVQVYNEHPVWI